MNRFGTVLKTKVLGGVLVAGMALPLVAGVPAEAQWRGGYAGQGYAQDYRQSYYGDRYYNNHNDLRYDYDRRGGVGPGKGALIGGAAGVVLGGILGGGRGALIGGAAGAGVGAVAGAANQNARRGYGNYGYDNRGYGNGWNGGYNGYGYSNRGYGYPYGY